MFGYFESGGKLPITEVEMKPLTAESEEKIKKEIEAILITTKEIPDYAQNKIADLEDYSAHLQSLSPLSDPDERLEANIDAEDDVLKNMTVEYKGWSDEELNALLQQLKREVK